jgi:mitochondrial import receptor subunit TOM40
MGNVGASSKPIQDPTFDLRMSDESQSESKQKKPLDNPGTMEELHKRCKGKLRFAAIQHVLSGFLCNFKINRFQPLICCCFLRLLLSLDVMPVFFEGAKLMVNKGLSNHFQVSHTINLCSAAPSGYRFGATYVGTKQFGPSEAFPVILGDIDPSGNLNANIIHQFAPNVRCKFASQVSKNEKHFATKQEISQISCF